MRCKVGVSGTGTHVVLVVAGSSTLVPEWSVGDRLEPNTVVTLGMSHNGQSEKSNPKSNAHQPVKPREGLNGLVLSALRFGLARNQVTTAQKTKGRQRTGGGNPEDPEETRPSDFNKDLVAEEIRVDIGEDMSSTDQKHSDDGDKDAKVEWSP